MYGFCTALVPALLSLVLVFGEDITLVSQLSFIIGTLHLFYTYASFS